MATILNTKSLYYNDVNLIAKPADRSIVSRKDIKKELYRIIVSPMDSLIGPTFIKEAARLGISVMLPRFKGIEWQIKMYRLFFEERSDFNSDNKCYISLGLKDFEKDLDVLENNSIRYAGIDIANGYLNLDKYTQILAHKEYYFDNFYVGNVHTLEGVENLAKSFEDIAGEIVIRVGIAGGSPCATSDMVGVNRGNITEIIECSKYHRSGIYIAADGGISKPANACKAFAAGANYIMLGGYFSNALEAETHIKGDGTYWGGASEKQLNICGIKDKHSEGKVLGVDKELVTLEKLVNNLWGGIASYISYSGHKNLTDVIGNGIFEIKQNSLPPKVRK